MRKEFLAIGLICAVLVGFSAFAHADPLNGFWSISSSGEALIAPANKGACSVSGAVPASLYDATLEFRNGNIIVTGLGIDMGATNCTSINFRGTGSYTVTEKQDGTFEANGTFSSSFVGRGAACAGTQLTNVAFTATGKTGRRTLTITTHGLDSGTYAEGPRAGPTTCSAPVTNLTMDGTGVKF